MGGYPLGDSIVEEGIEGGTPGRENRIYKNSLEKNGIRWVQGTEKNPKCLEWQEPGWRCVCDIETKIAT